MQILNGMGVSGGVAIGQAVSITNRIGEVYRFSLDEEAVDAEVARFEEALLRTSAEIERIQSNVDGDLGEEMATIFDAHLLMLRDTSFTGRVEDEIRRNRVNAEWAVYQVAGELEERFQQIEDEYLRERHQDIRDVGRHLIRVLDGVSHHELSEIEGDVIVVADDLTPADTVRLGREGVVAFVIETGSRTSHTTIIARSLNIPLVAGLHGIHDLLTDQDPLVVDGGEGVVILHPSKEALSHYRERRRAAVRHEEAMLATRALEARTQDGQAVHLMANIDLPEELDDVIRFGAAGVGLYRSEFLYIEKSPAQPTEEEHLALYRQVVETAAPHPAILRTYDLGGRKLAREMMDTREENPVLGLRGIRLTLGLPEVFRVQLRSLFRATAYGDLWILLPLISNVDEIRRFRAFAEEVRAELIAEGHELPATYRLGAMIEVPSAALSADVIAREVDFFSIGTNDLIQYSLAVDRNNEHVSHLYQPLHPAILRMLRRVIEAAREADIELSLCGEMASDPRYALLLIGMGLRRLSMNARVVPTIKTLIREVDLQELCALAERCIDQATAEEAEEILNAFVRRSRVAASS
ncbi:MAG: phosphoenolpyruvate--protein phosphotransferase [Acidobacteriota bacterium]